MDRFRTTITTVSGVIDTIADPMIDLVDVNVAGQLSHIRETVTSLVRELTRQKRTPATHIFVLMISSELRDVKPYALPVQCVLSLPNPTIEAIGEQTCQGDDLQRNENSWLVTTYN